MTKIAISVGLAAVIAASPAAAQEKTPANAFEFIRSNMSDGTWEGWTKFCYHAEDRCEIEETPIQSVSYDGGSYCVIRIALRGDRTLYRTLDLRKSFSIVMDVDRERIVFQGPVRNTNGEIE